MQSRWVLPGWSPMCAALFACVLGAETIPKAEVKVIGPIDYGQTSRARYSGGPRYRAFEFNGRPGDHVEIWVHARRGAPEAFLADSGFHSMAGGSAHFSAEIPKDSKPDIYYIIFRNTKGAGGDFNVELQRPSR